MTVELRSHGKINWYLRVVQRRADGFHEIETIYQEIALADEMIFEPMETPECDILGMPFELPKEQNLIWRAWKCMREHCGSVVEGLRVRIKKSIPACGGLGGASSNAATTLRAVNMLYKLGLADEQLEDFAASLGSDVPFFVRGGCAVGTGRGEMLQRVERVPSYSLLLAFPEAKVSTAEAYRRLSTLQRPTPRYSVWEVVKLLREGGIDELASAIHNDFEILVNQEPWFTNACSTLKQFGCLRTFLSGSGSTVVGLKNALDHPLCANRSEKYVNPSWVRETCTCP
ncbi:MAG: 4-(cytidine 5'-diphospho)-2-C-methyl-D-erythritol kinase [Candidatus Sumerlaeaceae bacterium]|nr:4-(cytidine 5'-diphospho)-2-C-methyl-D-erythritol kinase [Candidatus Sumerlaeaceae bacterium]